MECPNCHKIKNDDSSLCSYCGSEITVEPNSLFRENPEFSDSHKEQNSVDALSAEKPKAKKKAGFIIAALCIVAIIFVIFLLGKRAGVDMSVLADSVLYIDILNEENTSIGSASGFVIDDGMTLITNYHVIEDAYLIKACKADSTDAATASEIIAYDAEKDLAILKLDSALNAKPLILGDSDAVKQGDHIIAIGYPLGISNTVSDGIVGAVYESEGTAIIQITAPISHGSSGGAVFDASGNVIGISSGSYSSGQNLNIAIAVNELKKLKAHNENAEGISLSALYIDNHKYGCSPFNFSNSFMGNFITQDDNYIYYCDHDYKMAKHTIYRTSKNIGNGAYSSYPNSESLEIANGRFVNVYKGKLYYLDDSTNDITCCNKDGSGKNPLGIITSKKNSRGRFVESITRMLIAENKVILQYWDESDNSYVRIIDLDSGVDLLSIPNPCGVAYQGNRLYIGQENNCILSVGLNDLDIETYNISLSPFIDGVNSEGNVYYHAYQDNGQFSGVFCLDLGSAIEFPIEGIDFSQNAVFSCVVFDRNVYIGVNIKGDSSPYDDVYIIKGGRSCSFWGSDLLISEVNGIEELGYLYTTDGKTLNAETGKEIGLWVFN